MPNVTPVRREDVPEFEETFQRYEAMMGFVPNSLFLMARHPDILNASVNLVQAVYNSGRLDRGLKALVAHVASTAAGCRYCQAHTAGRAGDFGMATAKIEAVWDFERSPLFDEFERAALRLARDAAQHPNEATPEHFAELRQYVGENEIIEIVGMIALFGWLNRWNDTLATELEDKPSAFAGTHLGAAKWEPGKHRT